MLHLINKDRCSRCHEERQVRYCLRTNKNLGWSCCNEQRIDRNCPPECNYTIPSIDAPNIPFPAFKADSNTEFQHLVQLYIDQWIHHKNPLFDLDTPAQRAASDPPFMLKWLSSYRFPLFFPLPYLAQKLKLEIKFTEPQSVSPEEIASAYLDQVIAMEWSQLRQFTINDLDLDGVADRYASLLSELKPLKKLSRYDVISSGVSEDQNTAFVHLELNHKTLWTLILSPRNGQWKIRQNINGSPQEFYAQNKLFTELTSYLSSGDEASAWHVIERCRELFPDSADCYYYSGLYNQLVKQNDRAKVDFFNAITLDNHWASPYAHLAMLNLGSTNFTEAIYWFEKQSLLEPDDPKIVNNIAACYAGMKDMDRARQIWEQLLIDHPDFEMAQLNLDKLKNGV